eukprot:2619531-Rhodomonas_salina.3
MVSCCVRPRVTVCCAVLRCVVLCCWQQDPGRRQHFQRLQPVVPPAVSAHAQRDGIPPAVPHGRSA